MTTQTKPVPQNFTQFAVSHGYPSDYDVLEHGDLSPSGHVSNIARKQAQERHLERARQNERAHREYDQAILSGTVVDPSGSVTKHGLESRKATAQTADIEAKRSALRSQIATIEGLGTMSHLPSGALKKPYQRTVDEYKAKLTALEAPTPPARPQKEPWEMTKGEWNQRDTKPIAVTIQQPRPKGISESVPLPGPQTHRIVRGFSDKMGADNKIKTVVTFTEEGTNRQWDGAFLHKRAVETALSQGKPVPPEVLKDYPELGKKTEAKGEPWKHQTESELIQRARDGSLAPMSELHWDDETKKTFKRLQREGKIVKWQEPVWTGPGNKYRYLDPNYVYVHGRKGMPKAEYEALQKEHAEKAMVPDPRPSHAEAGERKEETPTLAIHKTEYFREHKTGETVDQYAKDYLDYLVRRSRALEKDTHPDALRDLIASKVKVLYFRGNYASARKWATDFTARNYDPWKTTREQDAKPAPSVSDPRSSHAEAVDRGIQAKVVTDSTSEWAKQRNRIDLNGVDTKHVVTIRTVKEKERAPKEKPQFRINRKSGGAGRGVDLGADIVRDRRGRHLRL